MRLAPEYTGLDTEIIIELNPEKNLGSNLDGYFHKAKKLQKSLVMGKEQITKLEERLMS